MNKAELVEAVAAEVGLTKKDVNNVVDAMTSAISSSLARRLVKKSPRYFKVGQFCQK